jgi:Putative DNA-binding domain
MSSLIELQHTMKNAILSGDMAHIAAELNAGSADARSRFNIFRNNTYLSLAESLRVVFPVTEQLSDGRFFNYAAHKYISERPPREARLSTYGSDFPQFLSTFPPCKDYPMIAEMAKLEWAIADSLNDAEEAPAPLSLVKETEIEGKNTGIKLQPNLRFVITRWPLLGVWTAHKKENLAFSDKLERRVSRVAIVRHNENIEFLELDSPRFVFWRSLAHGFPIEMAARRALARDPLFDLLREMIALFRLQLVTGVFASIQKGD